MMFERDISPKKALGIGDLGKRGLSYEHPYIKGSALQYHVKVLAWALSGWYTEKKMGISLFHFPCDVDTNEPPYVITAAPGEPTDYDSIYRKIYDSIYRKIEYPEIVSRFLRLVRESKEFRYWIRDNDKMGLYGFFKLYKDE